MESRMAKHMMQPITPCTISATRATPPPTLRFVRGIHAMQFAAPRPAPAADIPRNMLPSLDIFCDIL